MIRRLSSLILVFIFFSAATASATEIMFGYVGTGYHSDGENLAAKLAAIPGVTVVERDLFSAVYSDLDTFDQIWVYDLTPAVDNSPTQVANYHNIADWYAAQTNQNLIVDGRIISSSDSWTGLATSNGAPQETNWIQNYAIQLDLRGGGLVLGTDHSPDYTFGINTINSLIGINPFQGFYYTEPLQAVVDTASPLGISTWDCPTLPGNKCINDNSSTSIVPFNTQPNGQTLFPIAWHGGEIDKPAVAASLSSIIFPAPEPGTVLLLGFGLLNVVVSRYRRRPKR
jgi:PEP-CTERM motif